MKKREHEPNLMEKIENKLENLKFEIAEEMNFNKKGKNKQR